MTTPVGHASTTFTANMNVSPEHVSALIARLPAATQTAIANIERIANKVAAQRGGPTDGTAGRQAVRLALQGASQGFLPPARMHELFSLCPVLMSPAGATTRARLGIDETVFGELMRAPLHERQAASRIGEAKDYYTRQRGDGF